ncbi:MAG: GNAT family N-acetyltransferase [Acidobacteriota bacterium]
MKRSPSETELVIRRAGIQDTPLILSFIQQLARYEKLEDQVEATQEKLQESLFSPNPVAHVLIADWDGKPAGFAVYFFNYSTFLAQPGLYLEDLYVNPGQRGKGIGRTLLAEVAGVARKHKCGRLEWAVLDWNEPAIHFYQKLGATALSEWTLFRLKNADLEGVTATS